MKLIISKFNSGRFTGTRGERTVGSMHRIVHGVSTRLDEDSQGKHLPGCKNYIAGRSCLSCSMEHMQKLVDKYAGSGDWNESNNRERVDFGEVIGTFVNGETGERFSTTVGMIHYSKKKDSCHVIPARPKEGKQ